MSLRTRSVRWLPALSLVLAVVLALQVSSARPGFVVAASQSTGTLTAVPTPHATITSTGTATGTVAATSTAATHTATPTVARATATMTFMASPTATQLSTASPTVTDTPTSVPVAEPTPPRHFVVLIVVDAGRISYQHLVRLPHIEALARHGIVYDQAWVGELNSSTPNVHVTFGTGTLPRENGFLGFGWVSPVTHHSVDFRTLLAQGEIDPVLQSLPVPSIATRLHELIPHGITVAASGHKDYATVGLGGGSAAYELFGKFVNKSFIPAFMHTPPPLTPVERKSLVVKAPLAIGSEDAWAFRYATMVARHVRPRLLMINLPEIDTWGHWYGPNNNGVMTHLMKNIDDGIGRIEDLYRQMGILDRTDFIITSDHSMMQSKPAKNWGQIQNITRSVGAKVLRADSEGGAMWLQDPSQSKAVADRIVSLHPEHVEAVFYRGALGDQFRFIMDSPDSWLAGPQVATALQYLVDTTAGRNGPDLWVLYHENWSIVPRNVSGQWKGTHGGSTWKVQHVPLIISGPGIRAGAHSEFPSRAVDLAPTIERLLGLPAIKRDGVILADALTDPTRAEWKPQLAIARELTAYINALRYQSNTDDGAPDFWWPSAKPFPRCKTRSSTPPSFACGSTGTVASNQ
jgi:predicted AlkP superfamily pyrophosphatase or phosphodiesterase